MVTIKSHGGVNEIGKNKNYVDFHVITVDNKTKGGNVFQESDQ